jgi:hypothetical protein
MFIATGLDFADALAGGAVAPGNHAGVLLSDGSSPDASTDSYLSAHPGDKLFALGGPAASAYPSATGIIGQDRFETATKVATEFVNAPTSVGVARGDAFADALTGGVHISPKGGPILLVETHSVPAVVSSYLGAYKNTMCTAFLYGGTSAIDEPTRQAVIAAFS